MSTAAVSSYPTEHGASAQRPYGFTGPVVRKRPRNPTPEDAIIISSDSDSDDDIGPRRTAGGDGQRLHGPKSSLSLLSTKHTVPGNQSYRATYGTSQTQWPAQSRNGVTSQLTSVSSGVVTKAATSKLSAADLSIAVQQQFLSKSSQTLQNTAGRRSGSTGAHASKRQKKQHDGGTGDDDSEDVTIIEMGTKSVQSTTLVYSSSKDSSASKSRAPSCDDKEGHYKIIPNQYFGPRDRFKVINLIGQGTFGKVVRAWDREQQCFKAVKIIRAVQKYREAAYVEIRVLKKLKEKDPRNEKRCIHLVEHFDHRNHVCMVFDLLDKSIFDFLKENDFNPFPYTQIRDFAYQLLKAVAFLHDELKLVHTDLKPENLMLVNAMSVHINESKRTPHKGQHQLQNTELRLIDFGSATFDADYHSSIVSTRHYRAPEIILGLRWSYPCDVWSVGCILVEFLTGDALFQTHDNLEHLAMMQIILGDFPKEFVQKLGPQGSKYFRKDGKVDFPNAETPKSSVKFVKGLKPLHEILNPSDRVSNEFLDLVRSLVHYDQNRRMSAAQALRHPFFRV